MKQIVSGIVALFTLFSCNDISKQNPSHFKEGIGFSAKPTVNESLKAYYSTWIDNQYTPPSSSSIYMQKHKDEILKTLEVVEQHQISVDDTVALVFYRYSIGADIVRKASYFKKVDGNFYWHSKQYYSSYDDDPFKDGKGADAKTILKKADEWEKDNKWWAF